jgi:hypothetical protein
VPFTTRLGIQGRRAVRCCLPGGDNVTSGDGLARTWLPSLCVSLVSKPAGLASIDYRASLITLAATPADPIAAIELGEKSKSPHPSSGSLGTVHRQLLGVGGRGQRERHGDWRRLEKAMGSKTETALPPPAGRFCVTVVAAVEVESLSLPSSHPLCPVSVLC